MLMVGLVVWICFVIMVLIFWSFDGSMFFVICFSRVFGILGFRICFNVFEGVSGVVVIGMGVVVVIMGKWVLFMLIWLCIILEIVELLDIELIDVDVDGVDWSCFKSFRRILVLGLFWLEFMVVVCCVFVCVLFIKVFLFGIFIVEFLFWLLIVLFWICIGFEFLFKIFRVFIVFWSVLIMSCEFEFCWFFRILSCVLLICRFSGLVGFLFLRRIILGCDWKFGCCWVIDEKFCVMEGWCRFLWGLFCLWIEKDLKLLEFVFWLDECFDDVLLWWMLLDFDSREFRSSIFLMSCWFCVNFWFFMLFFVGVFWKLDCVGILGICFDFVILFWLLWILLEFICLWFIWEFWWNLFELDVVVLFLKLLWDFVFFCVLDCEIVVWEFIRLLLLFRKFFEFIELLLLFGNFLEFIELLVVLWFEGVLEFVDNLEWVWKFCNWRWLVCWMRVGLRVDCGLCELKLGVLVSRLEVSLFCLGCWKICF